MANISLSSDTVVKLPISNNPYYSDVESFRQFSGFVNPSDFPQSDVEYFLSRATEQVKKDGFYKVRYERAAKDSQGRYFTARKWWGNRYGAARNEQTQIDHGTISKYDIEVVEMDSTSSATASIYRLGGRVNRIVTKIPYDGIVEVDSLNGYFKLSDEYPRDGKQVFVTYYISGKPLEEISDELEQACNEWAMVLALRKLKDTRLYNGVVSFTQGRQTINRDENEFDLMVQQHIDRYKKWI
ncbi:MAG: hypothetical protein EOM21_21180, partial [Gammaproteobacteria bacterium]|nr:hypothetical protein [Gammaproteobacteria bacterium]